MTPNADFLIAFGEGFEDPLKIWVKKRNTNTNLCHTDRHCDTLALVRIKKNAVSQLFSLQFWQAFEGVTI